MATRNDIKNSKYLTKEDCDPAITVTVSECIEEDVSMANEPAEMKYILYFKGREKGLILNLTNWDRIEAIAKEPDSDNWGGTVITLFNDPTVDFGGKPVGGVRVWVEQVVPAGIQQSQQRTPVQQPPVKRVTGTNTAYRGDEPPPPTDAEVPFDPEKPDDVPY